MRSRLAITMGDAAGIGPEVTVKALARSESYQSVIPVVYGDAVPIRDAMHLTHHSELKLRKINSPEEAKGEYGTIELIDAGLLKEGDWKYKTNSAKSGHAAFRYIEKAIKDALAGSCVGVTTGPISKEAIHMAGHDYAGHTEIFAAYTGAKEFAMLLTCNDLRVIHVTTHVSMAQACELITTQRILRTIRLAKTGMQLLGFDRPRIAVAGFNAHCSENGLFGSQEREAILPAVHLAQQEGIDVSGPVPADTVFCKAIGGIFDIVVAMYHDQGHIPIKLLGFHMDAQTNTYTAMSGVNCTIGLPFIRTSVDHGTAYDRAGDGCANEQSMVEAIETAAIMAQNLKKVQRQE